MAKYKKSAPCFMFYPVYSVNPKIAVQSVLRGILLNSHPKNKEINHSILNLSEPAGNIVIGQLMEGGKENLVRGADFNEVAHVEKGGALGNPGGLLHGMGDDGNGIFFFQFIDEVFNDGRGNGVQG